MYRDASARLYLKWELKQTECQYGKGMIYLRLANISTNEISLPIFTHDRPMFQLVVFFRASALLKCLCWIHQPVKCSESCDLIGYQSGLDGLLLPVRDFPRQFRKAKIWMITFQKL